MIRISTHSLLGGILAGFPTLAAMAFACRLPQNNPFHSPDRIQVVAHRGGKGLWPENTLLGFQKAVELGVDALEMDVHSTLDGILVVIHDESVDRTTNGTGKVGDFTLAELQSLDAGYRWTSDGGQTFPHRGRGLTIPTLAEVFDAFTDVPMSIEIKHKKPGIEADVCDLIRAKNMADQVVIAGYNGSAQKKIRALCPGVLTSPGIREGLVFYLLSRLRLSWLYRPDVQVFQVPIAFWGLDGVHPAFLSALQKHGYPVQVWTVNDKETMRRLADLPLSGIITDYPDRLLSVLGR